VFRLALAAIVAALGLAAPAPAVSVATVQHPSAYWGT
jgi:hypothetical protein